MNVYVTIRPHDTLIVRDGRPFGFGQRIQRSVDWPYPSVTTGAVRTLLGKILGLDFTSSSSIKKLKAVSVDGPLPYVGGRLHFPAPRDAMVWCDMGKRHIMALRPAPLRAGEDLDLPKGLQPVQVRTQQKEAPSPAFWSKETMCRWLCSTDGSGVPVPPELGDGTSDEGTSYSELPSKDERIHVQIDPDTQVAAEHMLFRTSGLDLLNMGEDAALALRIRSSGQLGEAALSLSGAWPLGGERRIAQWTVDEIYEAQWSAPESVIEKAARTNRLRMVLATPALFAGGWLPGWLDDGLRGGDLLLGTDLTLISACVPRWRSISGWSYEYPPGPKESQRLVPAGAVYFFQVEGCGAAQELVRTQWLESVCDDEQDRNDGFGLALWGVW